MKLSNAPRQAVACCRIAAQLASSCIRRSTASSCPRMRLNRMSSFCFSFSCVVWVTGNQSYGGAYEILWGSIQGHGAACPTLRARCCRAGCLPTNVREFSIIGPILGRHASFSDASRGFVAVEEDFRLILSQGGV